MKIPLLATLGIVSAMCCVRVSVAQPPATSVGAATTLAREIKAPFIVTSVAFSPDGKTLASTGWDAVVSLWNVETGQLSYRLEGGGGEMSVVRFSPDGKWVACTSGVTSLRSKIIIWNALTGEKWKEINASGRALTDLCFSPDGHLIAASSGRPLKLAGAADEGLFGEVIVWDVGSGELKVAPTWDEHQVWSVAFSPDGKTVAGASNNEIRLWNATTGELEQRLSAPEPPVRSMFFTASGTSLIGGPQSYSEPQMWDLTTGNKKTFNGAIQGAWGVALSPDEKLLATATPNFPVGLWDVQKGALIWSSPVAARATLTVAFSPSGKILASSGEDGIIKLWRIK